MWLESEEELHRLLLIQLDFYKLESEEELDRFLQIQLDFYNISKKKKFKNTLST